MKPHVFKPKESKPALGTVAAALRQTARVLETVSETPGLDAQLLLAQVTGRPRAWVLAHGEAPLSLTASQRLARQLAALHAGTALPYLLGEWEFFGRPFYVAPSALIPRPETELLVETALDVAKPKAEGLPVVDVGTGSGCIAVTLASAWEDVHILATDRSPGALQLARKNAGRHQVSDRITFLCGDLLGPLETAFGLICANLPYIPTHRLALLEVGRREPIAALDGGPDGLELIRRLIQQLPKRLRPGGHALLEMDKTHGEAVHRLAAEILPGAHITVRKDLAGDDRLLVIER